MRKITFIFSILLALAIPASTQEKTGTLTKTAEVDTGSVTLTADSPVKWSSGSLWENSKVTIETTELRNGQIVVTKSQTSYPMWQYACIGCEQPKPQKKVWREIYGAKDGKIELLRTEEATVIPEQRTAERIVWPSEGKK